MNSVYKSLFKSSKKNFCQLKDKLRSVIPHKMKEYHDVKHKYQNLKLGDITVGQVLGGMRGMPAIFYETSKLDAREVNKNFNLKGIMYRKHNLFELCEKLKFIDSQEPIPEALIWYLFTGEVPNESQIRFMIKNIQERSKIPSEVEDL